MICESWRSKLGPYVDSELPERELANLEAHLRTCASCAADALGHVQLKRLTQSVGTRYAPTPQFRLRLEQKISSKPKSIWRAGWVPRLAAATAIVFLLVVWAGLWSRRAQHEQALTELADVHVTTLASSNPVDVVSTDRHTVKPWFAGKLPFTFNVPELEGSPYKLVGGRVVYFQHSPGAQLLFNAGKHRVSVFIFQDLQATLDSRGGTVETNHSNPTRM
jgi:anti-sigma factor RsiW